MTEKKVRFVPAQCIYKNRPKRCPVEEGLEFTARLDGKDMYRLYQSPKCDHPSAGIYFARCPHCHSKKTVEVI